MKTIHIFAAVALSLGATAFAQSTDHASHHAGAASAAAPATEGEVRKVDKEQGKLTLKHGRIENLDMPGMTMVFRVADPKMLDGLKEGDHVRFAADRVNGAITITAIDTVR